MVELKRAKEPFIFYTRLHLTELTGLRATTLGQLVALIKSVPGSCIYHHTHRFLQQHQYLSPEPPNDFAYWVAEALGEDELSERLASISIIQYSSIHGLREAFVNTMEDYLQGNALAKLKFSRAGEEFHFMKSVSFVLPSRFSVYDLKEFRDALKQITLDSMYFHIFEARLRLERGTNDFSFWMEASLGEKQLADKIAKLDPYTYTLEELRNTVIRIVDKRIAG